MTKVLLKTKSEFLRKNKEDIWKPCEKNKQKIKNHEYKHMKKINKK